jgi:hypothetical protein
MNSIHIVKDFGWLYLGQNRRTRVPFLGSGDVGVDVWVCTTKGGLQQLLRYLTAYILQTDYVRIELFYKTGEAIILDVRLIFVPIFRLGKDVIETIDVPRDDLSYHLFI